MRQPGAGRNALTDSEAAQFAFSRAASPCRLVRGRLIFLAPTMSPRLSLAALAALCALLSTATALENGLALTPPMGYNT